MPRSTNTVARPDAPPPRGRLLLVVNKVRFLQSHRLPVLLAARDAGYEVHVGVPHTPEEGDALRAHDFAVHQVPLDRTRTSPLRDLATLVALYRLYRRLRPDVVHHVTVKPVLYGSIAARLARIRGVVNAISGLGVLFHSSRLQLRLARALVLPGYRWGFRHPNVRVIVQNEDDLATLVAARIADPAHTVLIRGSGVDLAAFAPGQPPESPPIVLFLGRMVRDKGVAELVEAARRLKDAGVEARFVLVGDSDGNVRGIPDDEIAAWTARGEVEWWGHRDDIPHVIAMASVVCLPSLVGEGTPKTLLEAAAGGRPVVTSDVSGCRQLVDDGVNGYLVPPGDVVSLTSALRRLLADPALRQAMGRRNREAAERSYGIERVVAATLQVYASSLATSSRLPA